MFLLFIDKLLVFNQSYAQEPAKFFCVDALGLALETILFKSGKNIGLAFMENLCLPDDAEKCSDWHRKLCDQTARTGLSPGLIAYAVTQVRRHYTLEFSENVSNFGFGTDVLGTRENV